MGVSVSKYLEEAGVGCIGFREIDSFTHDTNGVSVKVCKYFQEQIKTK